MKNTRYSLRNSSSKTSTRAFVSTKKKSKQRKGYKFQRHEHCRDKLIYRSFQQNKNGANSILRSQRRAFFNKFVSFFFSLTKFATRGQRWNERKKSCRFRETFEIRHRHAIFAMEEVVIGARIYDQEEEPPRNKTEAHFKKRQGQANTKRSRERERQKVCCFSELVPLIFFFSSTI